jgi:RNA polymerase sigma factor (sigma-70 family)
MSPQTHKDILSCEEADCGGCRNRLFHANLPLVRFLVRRYFPRINRPAGYGAERDWNDLVQAGSMGLWHACLRRDPTKSPHEWRGYMARCIIGYLHTSMRDNGVAAFVRDNEGKRPFMIHVDFTISDNQESESVDNHWFRLADKRATDRQYELGNRPWWDLDILLDEDHERLRNAIEALPDRLKTILNTRLDDKSLQGAAEKLGISRERVRQLQVRALRAVYRLIHTKAPTRKAEREMISALNMFDPSHPA